MNLRHVGMNNLLYIFIFGMLMVFLFSISVFCLLGLRLDLAGCKKVVLS